MEVPKRDGREGSWSGPFSSPSRHPSVVSLDLTVHTGTTDVYLGTHDTPLSRRPFLYPFLCLPSVIPPERTHRLAHLLSSD